MRHRKKINSLGRKSAHRKETLSSMATALILHKRIHTTIAKAKALRVYVEPLITRSKNDSTHSRRTVFSYLKNKHAVSELFREVSQKVADRPGGYTRILKTGFRKGDAAEMCFIELVDYNTAMLKTEEDTQQKRTRRGGRGSGKKESGEVQKTGQPDDVRAKEPAAEERTGDETTDKPLAETETGEGAPGEQEVTEKAPKVPEESAETAEKSESEAEKEDSDPAGGKDETTEPAVKSSEDSKEDPSTAAETKEEQISEEKDEPEDEKKKEQGRSASDSPAKE